jgi:tetraacyldisaccharide 4'-kinase
MKRLLARIYAWAVARRNARYDSGARAVIRVDKPVVSIGNVSVGGSGKTPVTQLIVELLLSMRRRPAIVARGYKRRGRGLTVVHDGMQLRTDWTHAGDEPFMLASTLGVPVVVGPHKGDAAVHAAGMLACDVIVVDDGFQHRDLHRDLDIVLVDQATIDDQRMLPEGRLREPMTSLQRADVVVLMGPDVDEASIRPFVRPTVVIARILIERGQCRTLSTGADVDLPSRGIALSGIARPERFVDLLRSEHVEIVSHRPFPDHHDYTRKEVASVIADARGAGVAVLTTSKDAVKLHALVDMFVAANVTVVVVPIHATLDEGVNDLLAIVTERTTP